jgi:hypothetical protein
MFIPDPDPDFIPIPDPGVKKAPDPVSGSATLVSILLAGKARWIASLPHPNVGYWLFRKLLYVQ